MLECIKFSEDLVIYSTHLNDLDNKQLSEDLEINCELSNQPEIFKKMNPNSAGIQSDIIIVSKNIQTLENKILEIFKNFLKLNDENYILYKTSGVYISDENNKFTNYHNHTYNKRNVMNAKEVPEWTLVYYVSMPDNLLGDEGKLFFKNDANNEFSILPKEGQLLLFKASILHKPALNNNSKKKRIVINTNVAIIDRNKKYNKKEKTLL